VQVNAKASLGAVTDATGHGTQKSKTGTNIVKTVKTGGDHPVLIVNAEVGLGQILVENSEATS